MATGVAEPLPPSTAPSSTYSYPPVIIILTIILLIFFFAGFLSIYFCRCFMQNLPCTWYIRRASTGAPAGGATSSAAGTGLDRSIVESFPIFTYSTVKDYRKEIYGLECAICLVEFRSSDILRLLTACCHVFHRECIDLWLESHKTCPVCRRNLNSPVQSPVKSPRLSTNVANTAEENHDVPQDSCSITIKDEDEDDRSRVREKGVEGSCSAGGHSHHAQDEREEYPRPHSTGHSVRNRDRDDDRFTLILPENVKSSIIRGHNSSKSWTSFGEYKNKKHDDNVGNAETSGIVVGDDQV